MGEHVNDGANRSAEYFISKIISKADFQQLFSKHLVPPGSKFDCHGAGKWCYTMTRAEPCEPYELPKNRINHGRSYTEF